ncbi:hypothetical protein SAMN05421872_11019 [Nocardioides lianchengensis]|uniref:DUF4352 domain-containing protein n=2 Tax=Nocardioides lianchengensis TaxID=1045774 RepID=A0A1G6WRY0_9ACTN|nr:hypothetical protein SAMN05421872_11019 [Nocardioides lianchengensis]
MHNGRMLNRTSAALLAVLLGTTLLAGCSDDSDSGSGEKSSSASPSAAASYLPVPDGVELTAQGTSLAVGDTATVAWEPVQDTVGVLDIRVDRLEQTSFKRSFAGWKIDDTTLKTRPYFVRATITNTGETDLGGQRVPLYAVDGENRLVDYSGFGSSFKPCASTDFPEAFAPGTTAEFCLVYLVPDRGDLTAVSFRPTQEVNPITWTGELTKPAAASSTKVKKKSS